MKDRQLPEEEFQKRHPDFDFFFNKVAWAAITIVVMYAASQLSELSKSVAELNKNMAVVASQLQGYEKQSQAMQLDMQKMQDRILNLEVKNGRR